MTESQIERPSGPRIFAPWDDNSYCVFAVPEFVGTAGDQRFVVSQEVDWLADRSSAGRLSCALNAAPEDVGYDFRASLTSTQQDEIRIDLAMSNHQDDAFKDGHHTVLLDMISMDGFQDPTGENTFFYSDAGWLSLATLLETGAIENLREAVRPGCNYGKNTVLWDIVVRRDQAKKHMVGFMLRQGYAFSGDHPDWGTCLLIGCRWAELPPREPRGMTGWIFFTGSSLTEMENRYAKARRMR